MNDQPDNPSSDQPARSARNIKRANRSRRTRIYSALQRAWASVVGDTAADAAPKPQTASDNANPAVQAAPESQAQPVDAAPAANDAQAVEKAPSAKVHNTDDVPSDTTTEPQAAAETPSTNEQAAVATSAVSAGTASDTFQKIEEATQDLTFMSETDAPVDAFAWSSGRSFTPEALRTNANVAADEPLATEDIDRFFRNPTTPRDWHEDVEKEQVRRFTTLRDLLKAELSDITVYRFGSTAIEVYVVGRAADGSMLGIHTKVVET